MPSLQRRFALDPDILGPDSAISLDLGGTSDADVALALTTGKPFPSRAGGVLDLAHIALTASGGKPVAFTSGGLTVGFEFSGGVTAGVGIFDDAKRAIEALGLGEAPGLDLTIDSRPDTRYALLRTGYRASGAATGTHPIGAIGSLTFGISGAASGVSAVLHRFSAKTTAIDVLDETVKSWKLPRHVASAASLQRGTWVVAEADGSLAVKLAATVGYNFNFIREAKHAGLSGDIGLKIDASAKATFGFDVSGRYLVVVGRELDVAEDQTVRVRLFKLSSHGLSAGLNIKVGVTGIETIAPGRIDDFVKAVFGVHGAQVVSVLERLDEWTDPKKSVGAVVAGLTNEKALEMLHVVTGINPATSFDAARQKVVKAIRAYRGLGARVSSELWSVLGSLDETGASIFKSALTVLGGEGTAQKEAFVSLLNEGGFATTPIGRMLSAFADRGLLSLLDRLPEVRGFATNVLEALNGDVITKLEAFIEQKLNLTKVLDAAAKNDFDALDSFLVGRLSTFFDKELHFEDLDEIKTSIHLVLNKRQEVFARAQKALNSRYAFDLAAAWQSTTASTAVVDATFDTSKPEGQALLKALLNDGDLDRVMTRRTPAVRLKSAVLTHEMTRKTTLDVSLPHFSLHTESFNRAMARVTVEDEGDRLLLYDATGEDVVAVRNKFKSALSISIATAVSTAEAFTHRELRIHSDASSAWSYRLQHAKVDMRRAELEALTRPFIKKYMGDQFTGQTTLDLWYRHFDDTVESVLHNGPDKFGDVCTSLEVTVPGETLGAWLRPSRDVTSAAKAMSKAIQSSLKEVLPFHYFSDVNKLHTHVPTSVVLVWSALRPTNDVRVDGNTLVFDKGSRVFWDQRDSNARKLMADNQRTMEALLPLLPPLRRRLEEAGMHHDVQFYEDAEARKIIETAISTGDVLLLGLLTFESLIVNKAAEALADIQRFRTAAGSSPSNAIVRLADFAADITTAFNKLIGNSVFAGLSFRAVSQSVFAEASRALDPAATVRPRAMAAFTVLQPQPRTFNLGSFLEGAIPPPREIAVAQHLVGAR